jgi:hypothetical protein
MRTEWGRGVGEACSSTPSGKSQNSPLLVSFSQIHYEKRQEDLCPTNGKMGAEIHFFIENSETIVTLGIFSPRHTWSLQRRLKGLKDPGREQRVFPHQCLLVGF